MDLELERKRILVTGSSQGIGLGICESFVREGARVMITGRNEPKVNAARESISAAFEDAEVLGFVGDLTSDSVRGNLVSYVDSEWDGLDVLVLNLGSGRSVPGLAADSTEWSRVLELNLISGLSTLTRCEGLLKKGDSTNVVVIGSIAGSEALGAPYTYGAAKAALQHATKAASRDLGRDGIRVNLVSPGNVFFEGGTWDLKLKDNSSNVESMLETEVPLRRLASVQEIADVVVFLASERAAFVNGAVVAVDGGQTRAV
jgi:3-oxoacyl-[acyl-carrier protein] reductase